MSLKPKEDCPYCGRRIAVNREGKLYKHRMATPTKVMSGPYAGEYQPWCPAKDPYEDEDE
jgi:DNA-directed RNA polymerase subunit RPC12/RpoP